MTENTDFVRRVVPALAAWGVSKLLEAPQFEKSIRSIDRRVERQRHQATDAVRKAGKHAMENAVANGVWLAAGVIAVAAGIAMIARAARSR